jgi:hypothetical protein
MGGYAAPDVVRAGPPDLRGVSRSSARARHHNTPSKGQMRCPIALSAMWHIKSVLTGVRCVHCVAQMTLRCRRRIATYPPSRPGLATSNHQGKSLGEFS